MNTATVNNQTYFYRGNELRIQRIKVIKENLVLDSVKACMNNGCKLSDLFKARTMLK